MNTMNRRRFIRLAGVTLGACTLTCAGAGLLLAGEDRSREILPVGFPDESFGDDTTSNRILVAYASAAGSTGGVAEAIAKVLAFEGTGQSPAALVDVRPVQSVTDLSLYTAVVVGSAIHGRWLPEATQFVRANQDRLRRVPTAFFLVGMMPVSSSPNNRNLVAQYLEEERGMVAPAAEGRFTGALYPGRYPFLTGLGMRFFLAYCGAGMRGGDYRDLDAIQSWAKRTYPLLAR